MFRRSMYFLVLVSVFLSLNACIKDNSAVRESSVGTESAESHRDYGPPPYDCTEFMRSTYVLVGQSSYKVFFKKRDSSYYTWGGRVQGAIEYEIKDEKCQTAVLSLSADRQRFTVDVGGGFSGLNNESFIQMLIVTNSREKGEITFRDIFDQLEKSFPIEDFNR